MKRLSFVCLLAVSALLAASCGTPATNAPANAGNAVSNANTAKPAAPTKEALLELDKKANEAFIKGDTAHFEAMLSDKFVRYMNGARSGKADEIKMIAATECDVKSWSLDEGVMSRISDDVYVTIYKTTFEGTCTFDGNSEKIPSPMRAASVWMRSGDKWQGVYHNETPIVDPTVPSPPVKKQQSKETDKISTSADPNTATLMAVEQSVWGAWKDKDAKKIEDLTAKDLAFVNIFGAYFANRADTIKDWTEGKCEVKSVSVTDGVVNSLSATVSLMTHKGTADGACFGQKIGPVFGTSVYTKEGDTWKLAFTFNAPA